MTTKLAGGSEGGEGRYLGVRAARRRAEKLAEVSDHPETGFFDEGDLDLEEPSDPVEELDYLDNNPGQIKEHTDTPNKKISWIRVLIGVIIILAILAPLGYLTFSKMSSSPSNNSSASLEDAFPVTESTENLDITLASASEEDGVQVKIYSLYNGNSDKVVIPSDVLSISGASDSCPPRLDPIGGDMEAKLLPEVAVALKFCTTDPEFEVALK